MKQTRILLFTAPWCSPCKKMKQVVQEAVSTNANLDYKEIDISTDVCDLVAMYEVKSVPTIYIQNGNYKERFTGFVEAEALMESIKRVSDSGNQF